MTTVGLFNNLNTKELLETYKQPKFIPEEIDVINSAIPY